MSSINESYRMLPKEQKTYQQRYIYTDRCEVILATATG